MQRDVPLRALACAIYETVYPSEEWTPVGFEDAERFGTIHYRQAVEAAHRARARMSSYHDPIGQTGEYRAVEIELNSSSRGYGC